MRILRQFVLLACAIVGLLGPSARADNAVFFERARENAALNAEAAKRSSRTLRAVLSEVDPETGLVPDVFRPRNDKPRENMYRPHNAGADLYCYLVIASYLLHPEIYADQMLEMLRQEMRYTNALKGIPAEFHLRKKVRKDPSMFGAAEYAKDGLTSITELVGDSPWFWRMHDMVIDVFENSTVSTKFGKIPSGHSELNGDLLQVLPRLYWRTGDKRFRDWGLRLADVYIHEILPRNHSLPARLWDFEKHVGDPVVRLRDHGNETFVGLVLVYAAEQKMRSKQSLSYRKSIEQMADRVLRSANENGLFYNVIDPKTLKPIDQKLADSWGYIYGAIYNLYLVTGDERYRRAVQHVLQQLPKYKNYKWEGNHYDGYADSIEGAVYLVNREPNTKVFDWIDSEIRQMWSRQNGSGHSDYTYLEGNFIRTSLLYMLLKSQGVFAKEWREGVGIGAVREGETLYISINPEPEQMDWNGIVRFDVPRHRLYFNLPINLIRLNEFPEWYTVDPMKFYELRKRGESDGAVYLGAELQRGVKLAAGDWIVRIIEASYATSEGVVLDNGDPNSRLPGTNLGPAGNHG